MREMGITLGIIGVMIGIIAGIALMIGLYKLTVGKLVKGLRCFGLANVILFTVIAAPVIAFIVALAS